MLARWFALGFLLPPLMVLGQGCGGSTTDSESSPAGGGPDGGTGSTAWSIDIDAPRPSLAPDSPTVDCRTATNTPCQSPSPLPKGEDGPTRIRVPSYTVAGTTVADSVTQLTWQSGHAPGNPTWDEAVGYCDSLALEGASDWRLPSRIELETLIDFGLDFLGTASFPSLFDIPAADSTGWFQTSCFWTTTERVGTGEKWKISGHSTETVYEPNAKAGAVRCVRGPATQQQFTLSADGQMAFDVSTGLIWWRKSGAAVSWQDAVDACDAAAFDGTADWRLPSVKELASLVDGSRGEPAVDATIFPDMKAGPYWSSTYVRNGVNDAWVVTFGDISNAYSGQIAPGAWASFLPETPVPYLCVRH